MPFIHFKGKAPQKKESDQADDFRTAAKDKIHPITKNSRRYHDDTRAEILGNGGGEGSAIESFNLPAPPEEGLSGNPDDWPPPGGDFESEDFLRSPAGVQANRTEMPRQSLRLTQEARGGDARTEIGPPARSLRSMNVASRSPHISASNNVTDIHRHVHPTRQSDRTEGLREFKIKGGERKGSEPVSSKKEENPQKGPPNADLDPVEELNKSKFVVLAGGKACIGHEYRNPQTGRREMTLMSLSDLNLLYRNWSTGERETAASVWLESPRRREYEGIVFAPGRNVPGYYNLFQGFAVQAIKGNCSLYWKHVFFNICNGNRGHYRYLRKWMAHLVQRPDELPGVAIIVQGKQGTGKGFFVEQLGKIVGAHYMVLYRLEQITGRFNAHFKDALLVCANEAIYGLDRGGAGVIKGLITDPTTPIEYKGKDIIQVNNYKRLIVTTNEDHPMAIEMDDRRFLVLRTSDTNKEDKVYFHALAQQMENGGAEALMYDLLREDLAGFDVRTAPPSHFNFDIKLCGAEPIAAWWHERLFEGSTVPEGSSEWNQAPPRQELHKSFLDYCHLHQKRTLDRPTFGKKLRELMPGLHVGETRPTLDGPATPNGSSLRPRRVYCYELESLAECRKAFERYAKAGPEIWLEKPKVHEGKPDETE